MNVREDDAAARGASGDSSEDCIHCFRSEIVADSFPEEHCRERSIKSGLRQQLRNAFAIEIGLDEADVRRELWECRAQAGKFPGERGLVVHFEDGGGIDAGEAIGAAVEAGAENYDLANIFLEGLSGGVVNQSCAGDGGTACAG